ncbi:hypothetical protein K435DRAFT_396484 [Dendrothele bispora CBS 962.96]|uniref:Uncharacterized protein n=1 Tax=Dendrothele bispora (strain CBS 962.96) TaxID=1314807 RepID=A0A4S8MFW3_DENBC|nr:hypothetical protein K435DRAFT_396484 [Dendrothele bispora CBS 962.96]
MRRWFVSICFCMARCVSSSVSWFSLSPHGLFCLLPTFLVCTYLFTEKNTTQSHSSKAPWATRSNSANSNDVGGGATMFKCNLDPPEFDSNSDPDPDSHTQYVQLGPGLFCHHTYDILYPDNDSNSDQRLDTEV